MRGNCYVTCEALYHLLGGKASGWNPYHMKYEGDSHWFLGRLSLFGVMQEHTVLDPTASQFKVRPTLADYQKAKRKGFLTKQPSKRAKALMETMLWQKDNR